MPEFDTILAVALAGLALSATPGPSMLYVLSRSVGQSRSAGLASALGLGLGGMVLAVATALGLAALFAAFDWIVPALRIVGSLYLVWLGIDMIRDARASARTDLRAYGVKQRSFLEIVRQGILVEVLNPKTVLFFALFLPPFVDRSLGNIEIQLLVLGIIVPLTAIPSDLLVAWLGGSLSQSLNARRGLRVALAWTGGLMLIAIAANIHLGLI
ncbi:LysE family translocator [Jannaschia ovalis]|uniref:LysE family translocator n=1 Tax=Jannaschia ovalis TaxID=3038773 RepID=A0ABY8LE57_9RHOB|nr:LysE family translocator [Jannaschia sp. GRR-S6-38]WGH79594.1 LysE family translocator [Jannaschia sp. GRR-S6-38]